MRIRAWAFVLLVATFPYIGCAGADDSAKVAEAIRQVISESAPAHVSAAAWTDTQELYKEGGYVPVWAMEDEGIRADAAMQVIAKAKQHGLDPTDYGDQEILRLRTLQSSEDAPEKG